MLLQALTYAHPVTLTELYFINIILFKGNYGVLGEEQSELILFRRSIMLG